jgi:S1-C subfamily serine protease
MNRAHRIAAALVLGLLSWAHASEEPDWGSLAKTKTESVVAIRTAFDQPNHTNLLGTGFVVENSDDGLFVLTNFHVVNNLASSPDVFARKTLTARVEFLRPEMNVQEGLIIGVDRIGDAALIRLDPAAMTPSQRRRARQIPVLEFGDSDRLHYEEKILVIGNPLANKKFSATAKYRGTGAFVQDRVPMISFEGNVAPGNSGGPILNGDGRVIGMATSMLPDGAQFGFAVPSNILKQIASELRRNTGVPMDRMRYASLGVSMQPLTGDLMELLGLPTRAGAIVTKSAPGSPGFFDGAGLKRGDIVVGVNGLRKERLEGARDIEAGTLFSPWDRSDPQAPKNAMRYDVIPEHLVRGGQASEPSSSWRMSFFPDRKNWKALHAADSSRTNPSRPSLSGDTVTLLRLDLHQTDQGVWIDRDLNPESATRTAAESFVREIVTMDADGKPTFKAVGRIQDIQDILRLKPKNVLLILSKDMDYTPDSRVEYVVIRVPR